MSAIVQAFKDADLRKKILITIALIVLYRIGAQIPTPGVDYAIIAERLSALTESGESNIFSVISLFSGARCCSYPSSPSALCRTLRRRSSPSC